MKFIRRIILMTVSASFLLAVNAQKPIDVFTDSFELSNKKYTGASAIIPEADYETIKKSWIKTLESRTKSKVMIAENGELSIFGASAKSISEEPINIYSQIVPQDSAVKLIASIELKRDVYLSEEQNESEFNRMKIFLHDFAKENYTNVVKEDLKTEEKSQQILEKELNKAQNENERLEKSIVTNTTNIAESKDAISLMESELVQTNERLVRQKTALNQATSPEQQELLKAEVKSIEKDKKRTFDSIAKERRKVIAYESEISDAKLNIDISKSQQARVISEIETQKMEVMRVKTKLTNIESM